MKEAVILVGHGATATDTPRELVTELKQLEGRRRAQGISKMGDREAELDRQVRRWPRTEKNDPYKIGIERLAERLRPRLSGRELVVAYNEFCAPSLEETIESFVLKGTQRILIAPTMFTPGGVHSEVEIPEIIQQAGERYPGVAIDYAWPFDLDAVAAFLAEHVGRKK
jgi:sirohydrochlorin cobaltochelatase